MYRGTLTDFVRICVTAEYNLVWLPEENEVIITASCYLGSMITGVYSEDYGNGGLSNWSLANEGRGSDERGVASDDQVVWRLSDMRTGVATYIVRYT